MPLPWEDAFLNQWLPFVRAMGQRYDGNAALGYVVLSGLGQGVETFLAKTTADNAALTTLGGDRAWITTAKRIIAAYAEAFPTTPVFISMARPFPTANGTAALQEVVEWGVATYPGKFGLMTASLNAKSSTSWYPNNAIYTYGTKQPTGFQMLWKQTGDTLNKLNGNPASASLEQSLNKGVNLRGRFVEIYRPDLDNPDLQSTLSRDRSRLLAVPEL